jgi:hypothetical protein
MDKNNSRRLGKKRKVMWKRRRRKSVILSEGPEDF